MSPDKVVFYLPQQQVDKGVAYGRVRISRTKGEDILYPLRSRDSLTYRLLEKVARDNILRQLFFTNHHLIYSLNPTYPTGIVIPIFLKSQKDFINRVGKGGSLHERIEQIEQELKEIRKEIDELSFSIFSDFAITLLSNPTFLQKLKRRKIPKEDEFRAVLNDIIEKNKEQLIEIFTKNLDTFGKIVYAMELSQILEATGVIHTAQENYEILSYAVKLPDELERFKDALTKLASSEASIVSIRSVCLDCKLRFDRDDFYSLEERNMSRIVNLPTECPNCGGSAIIYYLSISGSEGLKELILIHKLQEAIVALALSKFDQIREIYVSKKISAVIDGNVQKGLEIDITAMTEDNRLIIVEVSTTPREDNAVRNVSRKLDRMLEHKIPFDKFIYISPTPFDRILHLGDKAYVLSAKHLAQLENYVRKVCFE